MTPAQEQAILLSIVETWRISELPEYRGFRCAHCQQYKNEAWYHWVNTGGYKLPIHLCDEGCHQALQAQSLTVDASKRQKVNRVSFGKNVNYSPRAVRRFQEIVHSWPDNAPPEKKAFSCDECGLALESDPADGMRKGFHVWWKMPDGYTLAELHFHRECAHQLGIT